MNRTDLPPASNASKETVHATYQGAHLCVPGEPRRAVPHETIEIIESSTWSRPRNNEGTGPRSHATCAPAALTLTLLRGFKLGVDVDQMTGHRWFERATMVGLAGVAAAVAKGRRGQDARAGPDGRRRRGPYALLSPFLPCYSR